MNSFNSIVQNTNHYDSYGPIVTFSTTGINNVKSATNSVNNNVNYVFTSNGTFTVTVPSDNPGCIIKVFLVGAGGAGGAGVAAGVAKNYGANGGGGGGGEVLETSNIDVSNTTIFNVSIGPSTGYPQDGSSTFFYDNTNTISYRAFGGGYGGSNYNSVNGGGGASYPSSGTNLGIKYSNSQNAYNTYTGGTGNSTTFATFGCGGGGAGAGGSGSPGIAGATENQIRNNGGIGICPSNYFVNNTIYYGTGGSTYVGGWSNNGQTPPFTPSISSANIWNNVSYNNPLTGTNQLINAPNNTGYGGIGGAWYYDNRSSFNRSYTVSPGLGGSGICIISIIT
jgi:hypothetical protein